MSNFLCFVTFIGTSFPLISWLARADSEPDIVGLSLMIFCFVGACASLLAYIAGSYMFRRAPSVFNGYKKLVLLVGIFWCNNLFADPAKLPQAIPPDVSASVVTIFTKNNDIDALKTTIWGSGIIIDPDGYIVTSASLLEKRGDFIVRFNDGNMSGATLVGFDNRSNVGLLKVDKHNLEVPKIGSSLKIPPGEPVFTLGNAGAFPLNMITGTVTLNKSKPGLRIGFLQTDLPLEAGMSGSPLINLSGEVVGMNTVIYSRKTGTSASFAMPIDSIMTAVDEIRVYGRVRWGSLGLNLQDVTPEIASAFNLPDTSGAMVNSLVKNKPAASAAIEPGDIVIAINGQKVLTPPDFIDILNPLRPGATVILDLLKTRKNIHQKLKLTVVEAGE